MFKSVKGKLVSATCRAFEKFPDAQTRQRLEASGWRFHTLHGPGDDVRVIIHPDGRYIDGHGSPHYESGDEKTYRRSCKKRWRDFALALAGNPKAPCAPPKLTAKPAAPPPQIPAQTPTVAAAAAPPARTSVALVFEL